MSQNARVTAFMVSELLRENQQEGGGGGKITPTQIRVKAWNNRSMYFGNIQSQTNHKLM